VKADIPPPVPASIGAPVALLDATAEGGGPRAVAGGASCHDRADGAVFTMSPPTRCVLQGKSSGDGRASPADASMGQIAIVCQCAKYRSLARDAEGRLLAAIEVIVYSEFTPISFIRT
jgi:hypothetical protein